MIFLKVYNRPFYAWRVLEALAKQTFAPDCDLLISIDGPVNDTNSFQIKEAIHHSGIHKIYKTRLIEHHVNLGLTEHVKFGFEEFLKSDSDYLIHMEDDGVPCHDCLEWMHKRAWPDDSVFATCSMNAPDFYTLKKTDKDNYDPGPAEPVNRRKKYDVLGPTMFSRKIIQEIEDKGGIFGLGEITKRGFEESCNGADWLKEITKNPRGTFDWPLHKYFRDGRDCYFPVVNRAYNIGKLGHHGNTECNVQNDALNSDDYL